MKDRRLIAYNIEFHCGNEILSREINTSFLPLLGQLYLIKNERYIIKGIGSGIGYGAIVSTTFDGLIISVEKEQAEKRVR